MFLHSLLIRINVNVWLFFLQLSAFLCKLGIVGLIYNYSYALLALKLGALILLFLFILWFSFSFTEKQANIVFYIFLLFSFTLIFDSLPFIGVAQCENTEEQNLIIGLGLFLGTTALYVWQIRNNIDKPSTGGSVIRYKLPETSGDFKVQHELLHTKETTEIFVQKLSSNSSDQYQTTGVPFMKGSTIDERLSNVIYDLFVEKYLKIVNFSNFFDIEFDMNSDEFGTGKRKLRDYFNTKILPILNNAFEVVRNTDECQRAPIHLRRGGLMRAHESFGHFIKFIHQHGYVQCYIRELRPIVEQNGAEDYILASDRRMCLAQYHFYADSFCEAIEEISKSIQ